MGLQSDTRFSETLAGRFPERVGSWSFGPLFCRRPHLIQPFLHLNGRRWQVIVVVFVPLAFGLWRGAAMISLVGLPFVGGSARGTLDRLGGRGAHGRGFHVLAAWQWPGARGGSLAAPSPFYLSAAVPPQPALHVPVGIRCPASLDCEAVGNRSA